MENKTQENVPEESQSGTCRTACGGLGQSQALETDETNTEDMIGTSHYERAERDMSKGLFARQTTAANRAMEEINENDDENAKDNNSDYMDELKEESEALGDRNDSLSDKLDLRKIAPY